MNLDLIPIAGGSIALRDDRTQRRWSVQLAPYALGRTPVTQAFYRQITGLSPSAQSGNDRPVDSVSWLDAIAFCNLVSARQGLAPRYAVMDESVSLIAGDGYRLPTEAEWEFACRAGSNAPRYGPLDDIAWYQGNADGHAHDVGLKQPNAWGLHDMLGNVWEWCWDQYDEATYGSYRIFRGGGWADAERGCLATNRRRSHPTFAIDDLGFRLAR